MVGPIVYAGGRATEGLCAMEHLSREQRDATVTDFPVGVDRGLARLVQVVNDSMCDHSGVMRLCDSCAGAVMGLARRAVGSRPAGWSLEQTRRLYAHLALTQARRVEYLSEPARAVNDLVQAWLDGQADEIVWNAARAAAALGCGSSCFPDVFDQRGDAALAAAHAIVNLAADDPAEQFVTSLIGAARASDEELIDTAHRVIDMFGLLSGAALHPCGPEITSRDVPPSGPGRATPAVVDELV